MKYNISMEKKVLYMADSSLLSASKEKTIYSIVSICGNNDIIYDTAKSLQDISGGTMFAPDSFSEWFQSGENQQSLLNALIKFYQNRENCIFNILLTDHDFSKFRSYLNSLCSELETLNMDSMNDIDRLYHSLDSMIFEEINVVNDVEQFRKINDVIEASIRTTLPKERSRIYFDAVAPIEKQMEKFLMIQKTLFSDISIVDYFNYYEIFQEMLLDNDISDVYASDHCLEQLRVSLDANNKKKSGHSQGYEVEYHKFSNQRDNVAEQLINNLIVINDYAWNKLHSTKEIDNLVESDKLLIMSLWMLYQSKYSNWIFSPADYKKIKSIFDFVNNET